MKPSRSLRSRIQLWYVVFLVLAVTGAGVVVYEVLKAKEQSMELLTLDYENTDLLARMRPYVQRASPLPSVLLKPGKQAFVPPDPEKFSTQNPYPFYYAIWEEGRLGAVSEFQPPGITPPDRTGERTQGGSMQGQRTRGEFRETYETSPGGRHAFVLGRSIHAVKAKSSALGWTIAACCAGVLVLGLVAGWWLIGLLMHPLQKLSAATKGRPDSAGPIEARGTGSELESIATALNDSFARLDKALQHEANFTSDAAHELRTPVSVLLAETQLALDQPGTTREEAMASIAVCRRAAQRMQALIESLLDLSVIEGNSGEVKREPCDLAEVARNALEIMQLLAAEKGMQFRDDLDAAPCSGDPDRLLQIVLNLLSNALKFSPADSEVTVSTRAENDSVLLTVRDRGCGIAAEKLPHIFERFYRVDGSRARASGGAGLGLAICESIAKAHGGTLAAESTPGEGSTFTLTLPQAPSK